MIIRPIVLLGTLATSLALIACFSGASRRTGVQGLTTYQRQVQAESLSLALETDTIYKRRMLDLIRRSRAVPTDSLARLLAALPRTPQAEWWRLRQAIGCELGFLANKYGMIAYSRAEQRTRDSLQRAGIDLETIGEKYLTSPGPPVELTSRRCGDTMFRLPRLPDSLHYEPRRSR